MEKKVSKPKVIAGIAALLVIASLLTTFSFFSTNRGLNKNLGSEKINSEKLLAEKLLLDKEIARYNDEINQFKQDINNLKGKNSELDNLLTSSRETLSQKQAEINRLVKANAGKKTIEKELTELKRLKNSLESQISELNNQVKSLSQDNATLVEDNNSLKQKIDALETQNKELTADNQVLKSMAADDYLLAGFKGRKDKLTLVARRTNKLTLSFDVPEDITTNLKFNIINPDGQKIEGSDNSISTRILEPKQGITTSGIGESGVKLNKRIFMEYNPKAKFVRGVYKIEIYNNDNYLGSCQVRLK